MPYYTNDNTPEAKRAGRNFSANLQWILSVHAYAAHTIHDYRRKAAQTRRDTQNRSNKMMRWIIYSYGDDRVVAADSEHGRAVASYALGGLRVGKTAATPHGEVDVRKFSTDEQDHLDAFGWCRWH